MKTIEILSHKNRIIKDISLPTVARANLISNTIFINPNYSIDALEEGLFHEILENIKYYCELDLEHNILSMLSSVLYDTLKRNNLLKEIINFEGGKGGI